MGNPVDQEVATVGVFAKTIEVLDTNGVKVQVQVLSLADDEGNVMVPLTERTGRAILDELRVQTVIMKRKFNLL